ncbi:PhzF family phenazine biosynthesis isomerase [Pseudoxanthomonas sp. Root630]|uniref:PhzF family phenazine biosynthesis protein n=1 Tax=Pseudoxanthomonas sp. Root630 TaxID=1736574 RepID=UPI00070262CC|nr:PhzF family phenazine biosynthesis isomerase [Pseudoxanthomonas sp. Root630]KRA45182.1 phenazine biosynthesis protein PhzF [Pseudoxanthomonas sp. Root630]
MTPTILRYSAFTTDPAGGNPAGVVLDARSLSDDAMQRIAAGVGYSETAFLLPRAEGELDVRYFSPLAEVSFCGHATIAAMVAYAHQQGPGDFVLHAQAGRVRVTVDADFAATLTSVAARVEALDATDLDRVLAALRWHRDDLDPTLPPAVAYAGAWHPVIAAASRARLADLHYDFDALSTLMAARGWTTVNLVWREDAHTLHARNPFPPGGVVEDPATGAAAAALGAYLATHDELPDTRRFRILQGHDIGRPSLLQVEVPRDLHDGVRVSGAAVELARVQ